MRIRAPRPRRQPAADQQAGDLIRLALDSRRRQQVEPDQFGDEGWQVRPEMTAAAVLGLYRREIELADKIITATSPEAPPA